MNLKYAIGIRLFIAFVGLQNAGMVVKNEATPITPGTLGAFPARCGLLIPAGLTDDKGTSEIWAGLR